MSEPFPSSLKLEVKISRTVKHSLSERDLSGIAPTGYTSFLITSRMLHGPRWVLSPARQLRPRLYEEAEVCSLADGIQSGLCREINRVWSDWLLDENVWTTLFQQDHMKIKPAIEWCLQHHPPRCNKSQGNLREGRLADALQRFRAELDKRHGENSAQQEGFIHQYLLAYSLEALGYNATVNAVGVPDISAILRSEGASASCTSVLLKLEQWHPADTNQQSLRELLLRQSEDTLKTVRDVLSDQSRGNVPVTLTERSRQTE